ncbi:MAG: pilus assembly protein PilM [Pirellulales bacterium]
MARSNAAWGIDIGQCALKAIRCRRNPDEPGKLIAEAFDYIEYPKILTQPDAEPEELIAGAIEQFLSRNSVKGTKVAISVSTQGALARFISLPPVETKKIPDIVKYEAKQQIPFNLDEVIWDYQRMSGGAEEEGFALETEVGLFAMKRDQVYKALQPLRDADIDVDIVQLSPLAIYNFICFDRLTNLPSVEDYDPEDPPPSTLALSIGTQTTDLVVTNGFRIWQRTLQIGGSDFTKALTKELNLTYAKAEHLKRNAAQAEDPKAVYQAMRPVFKTLLSEVQKSMGYFSNLDRAAKIGQVLAVGNSIKLPGLKRYLSQNLGQEIEELESLHRVAGPEVTLAPSFKENLSSFAVCYGLAVQALGVGKLSTNLVPREIVRDRIIRDKKPWAVAAAAVLMFGMLCSYALHWSAWSQAREERYAAANQLVTQVSSHAGDYKQAYEAADTEYKRIDKLGNEMVETAERRTLWLQAIHAIRAAIPRDQSGGEIDDVSRRRDIYITEVRAQRFEDLSKWFTPQIEARLKNEPVDPLSPIDRMGGEGEFFQGVEQHGAMPGAMAGQPGQPGGMDPAATTDGAGEAEEEIKIEPPTGSGLVIELHGYHYHNPIGGEDFSNDGVGLRPDRLRFDEPIEEDEVEDRDAWKTKPIEELSGGDFVRRTLLDNLENATVEVPTADGRRMEKVTLASLGFSHPVLYEEGTITTLQVPDPNYDPSAEEEAAVAAPAGVFNQFAQPAEADRGTITVARFPFVVQVVWRPRTDTQRASEAAAEQRQETQTAGAPLASAGDGTIN